MTIRDQLQHSLGDTYKVEREIGRGGMATVYLARDEKHRRNVALKVLDPELGAVLGAERFLSEIRVTAGLQHPNLLPLFDSGEAGGLLYYVMPFVEGESLRQLLDREKQLPVDEAVRIGVAIAGALAYAHSHGVVHRDLKPENILLQAGQPVIADFGIALAVSNAGGARITQTGLSLGTPQYMSPEQATGDRVIDGRTDVYSLAAVTYEMLCGEPPHSGTSAQAIIAKLMTTEPQPIRTLRPTVPPNVAMAVEHGLAKLPADRFATAKAFADALTNAAFTTSSAATMAPSAAAVRSSRAVWALAATSGVLAIAAAWGWMRPTPPQPVRRYTIVPDTNEALWPIGRWGRIALSPDGSMLVYVGGQSSGLMLRRRDELVAKPIPGTAPAGGAVFSPDGRRIAFIQNARTLKIASLDGSAPITVVDSLVGLGGLSWGDDDYLYADGPGFSALVRVAARAGARVESFVALDTALHETDQVFPQVLPGGKGILYTAIHGAGANSSIGAAILDPRTGARHLVLEDATRTRYAESGHLVYTTRSGALMAVPFDLSRQRTIGDPVVVASGLSAQQSGIDFSISRSGTLAYVAGTDGAQDRELVWVDRTGRVQVVDSVWHGSFVDPAVSPDGKRLAISTSANLGQPGDIWIRDLISGGLSRVSAEGNFNRLPMWSHDGKTLRYASFTGDTTAVFAKLVDGSAPTSARREHVLRSGVRSFTTTPDDRWFLWSSGANARIFARSVGDTTTVELLPNERAARSPAMSPDGKWIAYVIGDASTQSVYVSPFPNASSTKWLVTPRGGTDPVWSSSGKEIIYRATDPGAIASVAFSATPTVSLGPPRVLFPAGDYIGRFAIAHDDSRFLMVRPIGGRAPLERLTIVENWVRSLGAGQ